MDILERERARGEVGRCGREGGEGGGEMEEAKECGEDEGGAEVDVEKEEERENGFTQICQKRDFSRLSLALRWFNSAAIRRVGIKSEDSEQRRVIHGPSSTRR